MTTTELAPVLVALGCPSEKSLEMASQLDKRARQLAAQKNKTYDEALTHLLTLMKQGWAAAGRIQETEITIQDSEDRIQNPSNSLSSGSA
ncbi:MAG: hypothetical protein ABJC04_01945 [Verrucomicrobiota bacterium]